MLELKASLTGLASFGAYLGAGVGLTGAFLLIYTLITPYKEMSLIRSGNVAAAVSLSGALFGFLIPLGSAITHSVSLPDMLVWGGVALVTQLLAYLLARIVIPGIAKDIPEGKVSVGVFLGAISLAIGMLDAACMSY
ncbi:MAG: DUF350 domain-containing protein [Spirochaetia bacterium]|nr:DUF350 domain-containing protein [Spirochaetia bacterium]